MHNQQKSDQRSAPSIWFEVRQMAVSPMKGYIVKQCFETSVKLTKSTCLDFGSSLCQTKINTQNKLLRVDVNAMSM
jgi:hypothetical protein